MPFLQLLLTLIHLYVLIVVVQVIISLLLQFNVINGRNELVQAIYGFLTRLVDPALKWVRRYVKPINGIDISPIVLILGLELLRNCIGYYIMPMFIRSGL